MATTTRKKYDDSLPLATIYAAERQVERILKQGGTVEFYGSTLDLRDCSIPTYHPAALPLLQGVVNGLYAAHRDPDQPVAPPVLRFNDKPRRTSWYQSGTHEIALTKTTDFMNGLILAHEVAHAADGKGHNQRSAHGKSWRRIYAAMVRDLVGPEASLLLQDALHL